MSKTSIIGPPFKHARKGASLTGYGLIVGLISIVALASVTNVGSSITDLFGETNVALDGVTNNSASQASAGGAPEGTPTPTPTPAIPTGTSYSFSSCGQTAEAVPTQGLCDTAYQSTTLAGLVTVSSGLQSFTIPESGTWEVTLRGAQGSDYSQALLGTGSGVASSGGQGGVTTARRVFSQGDVVVIGIGQQGRASAQGQGIVDNGGFNGGGSQRDDSHTTGGGGGTDLRLGGSALVNRILVAGGGGGGVTDVDGGDGGGTTGEGGGKVKCTDSNRILPTGGTQSAGGDGGGGNSVSDPDSDGAFGVGGSVEGAGWNSGGGGGGGWYGGGGGWNCVSGAGGSSYADGSWTDVTLQQGGTIGDGSATLEFISQ